MKEYLIPILIVSPFILLFLLIIYSIFSKTVQFIKKSKEKRVTFKTKEERWPVSTLNEDKNKSYNQKYKFNSEAVIKYDHIEKLKEFGIDLTSNSLDESFIAGYCNYLRDVSNLYEKTKVLNILSFDMEIIEDYDIYSTILKEIEERCSVGFLNITPQSDEEYIEMGSPEEYFEVNFSFNDKNYKWPLDVYYDWFDASFIEKLNKLLNESNSEKYFYGGIVGSEIFIFFLSKDYIEEFNILTKLNIKLF